MSNPTTKQASIDRAMTKARTVAAAGIAPRFIGWAAGAHLYKVASASHDGHEYLVTARRVGKGIATTCDCQAAQRGLCCYHRGLVRMELAGELAPVYGMAAD
jgi:hypothetical protein